MIQSNCFMMKILVHVLEDPFKQKVADVTLQYLICY